MLVRAHAGPGRTARQAAQEARGRRGASGRNGGFALRGLAPPYDEARETLGGAAGATWELTERMLDAMGALCRRCARRDGSLRLAVDGAERDAVRREYEALRRTGSPPSGSIRCSSRSRGCSSAAWCTRETGRWLPRLGEAAAVHAAAVGAEILEHHPVDRDAIDASLTPRHGRSPSTA